MPQLDAKKVSTDLFTLTYGSMVSQILADYESVEEANNQLEKMGYNIGLRLVEDYLAKSSTSRCRDMKDVADKIQHAFQLYLNVVPTIDNWSQSNESFSIILHNNPLTEFVELPEALENLKYLNILPGIIRGALEMVSTPVDTWIESDLLKGESEHRIRVQKKRS